MSALRKGGAKRGFTSIPPDISPFPSTPPPKIGFPPKKNCMHFATYGTLQIHIIQEI